MINIICIFTKESHCNHAPSSAHSVNCARAKRVVYPDGGDDDDDGDVDVEEHEDDGYAYDDFASLLEVDGQLDGKDDEQGADCPDQD